MTPKEKAKDLVNRLKPHSYNGAIEENDELMELYHAKQCALVVVDEILKSGCTFPSNNTYYGCNEEASEYWLEVKQEINNL